MVSRPGRPYWLSWLGWQLHQRHRFHRAAERRSAWRFIEMLHRAPAGAVAIDAGANVGKITAAMVRSGMEVHAFEPDPAAFAVLQSRFGGAPRVYLYQAAVGAQADRLTLYRTQKFNTRGVKATVSSSLMPRAEHVRENRVEVEVVDLASFIRGLGRDVYILKLDVEGFEVAIIERLIGEGLDRNIGTVYAETHERHSPALREATDRLRLLLAERSIRNVDLDWR